MKIISKVGQYFNEDHFHQICIGLAGMDPPVVKKTAPVYFFKNNLGW